LETLPWFIAFQGTKKYERGAFCERTLLRTIPVGCVEKESEKFL